MSDFTKLTSWQQLTDVLLAIHYVRNKLADPAHWSKGAAARDAEGHPTAMGDPTAKSRCINAALAYHLPNLRGMDALTASEMNDIIMVVFGLQLQTRATPGCGTPAPGTRERPLAYVKTLPSGANFDNTGVRDMIGIAATAMAPVVATFNDMAEHQDVLDLFDEAVVAGSIILRIAPPAPHIA